MNLEGIIQIGTIINSHGTKGELKVLPTTDDPDIFLELDELTIVEDNQKVNYSIINARETKKCWLLTLDQIADMDSAKKLKGKGLFTEEINIRPLEEDEFFVHDLLGSTVYSTEEELLGKITDYFEAGSQGVCEVTTETGSFLFPTSAEILKEVVPPDKVVIHLVPDLLDLNRTNSK